MAHWLLTPPAAFAILLLAVFILFLMSKKLAIRPAKDVAGKRKLYACGEDLPIRRVQPDYRQFFPFAFFFTIMHVVALVVATMPKGETGAHGMAIVYVIGALAGLRILFRG
jgi:hypothetical protein